ncbi:MAG TPA: MATE family efflux transporter, partial [Opitutus sp.]|nr:MATE family efflux transporter [Opitutus sp.]
GAGVAGIFMLGLVFAGEAIARWFVSDTVVIALAAQLLIVAGLFQFFDAGQVVGAALLRALKDVKIPALVTLVAYWAVAIGGGYVLGFRLGLGSMGIWSALAGGLALAAVLLAWRFRGKTG